MISTRLIDRVPHSLFAKIMLLALFPIIAQSRPERMPVSIEVSAEIIQVLDLADNLNNAFVEEDLTTIDERLGELLVIVRKATRQIGKWNPPPQVLPIVRHLEGIARHLEVALASDGEIRNLELKNIFSQVAGLVKAYDLPKIYQIFFCQADGVTWMQKGRKAKHPMNPKSHCGISVL